MLTLIYGTDTLQSYKDLDLYKSQGYENFLGNYSDLFNLISSVSLFNKHTKFIVNLDINILIKVNKELEELLLKNNNLDLIFYIPEPTIKASLLNIFDKKVKRQIEDNKEIFKYLDAVFTKSSELALLYTKKNTGHEVYIISMFFYVLKNLLLYHNCNAEFKNINKYVQEKTELYVKKGFTKEKCMGLLFALSEADYRIKMGSDVESVMFSLVMYMLN